MGWTHRTGTTKQATNKIKINDKQYCWWYRWCWWCWWYWWYWWWWCDYQLEKSSSIDPFFNSINLNFNVFWMLLVSGNIPYTFRLSLASVFVCPRSWLFIKVFRYDFLVTGFLLSATKPTTNQQQTNSKPTKPTKNQQPDYEKWAEELENWEVFV